MKRSMLVLFLVMGIVKLDTSILDKKLPVVVAISDCPQKPEMEMALQVELQKRQMNVITDQAAGELFKDQMKRVQANTKESIRSFPPTKEGMAKFFENQMDQVSNIAQKIYVTTVLNANMELDSCYYFIRSLPEFLPQSKRKNIDTKVYIPDSVIKKNDSKLLASSIVELCTRKKDAKK